MEQILKKKPLLSNTKVKSEEQIISKATAAEKAAADAESNKNPKTLKEKSMSSSALRVGAALGPFAAIRENEMKRKKKSSLDLESNEEEEGN
ncbi:hypothetical protein DdX_02035 [Ditylenchus destructor]|uniref:Uncharacterized protein n=1 Tax=Ditylenchus destructor TaxID=166010 RepID=A0AAD4NBR7_9BILA|nr:hypothetical protein DdX_02035 [Ditylenchus destructor]